MQPTETRRTPCEVSVDLVYVFHKYEVCAEVVCAFVKGGLPDRSTIFVRFNVAYGAPAPREGVQPEEGGTLQGWGYIRVLPARGYRH